MLIGESERLRLRDVRIDDADFLCRILNQPSWLAFIGDRGVRNRDDAAAYIEAKVLAHHREHGFGMNVIERREDDTPVGLCGLVQRDFLPCPDIGYALLEDHWGHGYAREAAALVLDDAMQRLGLPRLLAITLPENQRSSHLLRTLGFRLEDASFAYPDGEIVHLYAIDAPRD